MIWFIPLDFIKFGLQAVFHRSLKTIKPFEHIHRRLIASRKAKGTVVPLGIADKDAGHRLERAKRLSQQEQPFQGRRGTRISIKLDEVSQSGSSFYAPYTDPLSILRIQNPLLTPASTS